MQGNPEKTVPSRSGVLPLLLPFMAAMLLLNAGALQRGAENLAFDHPMRATALRCLAPIVKCVSILRLDAPRNLAEAIEKTTINE